MTALTASRPYADGEILTATMLTSVATSIENYTSDVLIPNFNQVAADGWGSAYTLDNDGNANRTHNLYAKQNVDLTYGTVVALATTDTGVVQEVSASLRMAIVAEASGAYVIGYSLPWAVDMDASTGSAAVNIFAISFASSPSAAIALQYHGLVNTTVSYPLSGAVFPVYISRMAYLNAGYSATFTLAYEQVSATNITNSEVSGAIYGWIHKV